MYAPRFSDKEVTGLTKGYVGGCWRWDVDENGLGVNGGGGMEGTEQEEQSRAGEGEEREGWWGQDWLFGTDLRHVTQEGSSGQTGENPSFVEFWEIIKIIQATIKNVSTSSKISPNIIFEDTMSAPEGRTREKKSHT